MNLIIHNSITVQTKSETGTSRGEISLKPGKYQAQVTQDNFVVIQVDLNRYAHLHIEQLREKIKAKAIELL
jgi:hypothetical protein